ncbi:hypothetical protein [Methylobacterium planeticum]|uniref:Uncharacterized protein n=1 Tax=Methylobacterium planeticum TaxID=2615211 RepID=A0A6N6MSE1_9HYPH|nr:hypothetical protein [Methylobacterium planeticum]KAB1071527.1 hypothetical protein F6X51_19660 [Methylobacterium planeticum]
MTHSIFIRSLGSFGDRQPRMLAYDITSRVEAETLARNIATAYHDHGLNPATEVYWFRYNGSVHEIYVE